MGKFLTQMSFEEREAHYKSLRIAVRREMEKWEEGKIRAERKESEGKFRAQWEYKKGYDESQSAARRNMGDMSSIGRHP